MSFKKEYDYDRVGQLCESSKWVLKKKSMISQERHNHTTLRDLWSRVQSVIQKKPFEKPTFYIPTLVDNKSKKVYLQSSQVFYSYMYQDYSVEKMIDMQRQEEHDLCYPNPTVSKVTEVTATNRNIITLTRVLLFVNRGITFGTITNPHGMDETSLRCDFL